MKVLIVGAGKVGSHVAADLRGAGHDVTVIEQSRDRIARLESRPDLSGVQWVAGDACEVTEFERAEPNQADVLLAVTGDDEDNLVTCLLAKQEFAVPKVVARVNHPENEWLFTEQWGVDVAVSTPHLLSALLEEAFSVGSFVKLLSLAGGRARLIEVTLHGASPAVGQTIAGARLPRSANIVAIIRSGDVVMPFEDVTLYEGDEVLVLLMSELEDEVQAALVG